MGDLNNSTTFEMRILKSISLFLGSILLLFMLGSWNSQGKQSAIQPLVQLDDSLKVPAGFDPTRHILLFAEMPRLRKPEQRNKSVTAKMEKTIQQKWPYKYEVVSTDDIVSDSSKYSDTSVYRYAVISSLSGFRHTTQNTTTTHRSNGPSSTVTVSPSATTTVIDYRFYDRVERRQYETTGRGSSYVNLAMMNFIKMVEKSLAERKK